ncbi:MAG: ABC transporter permease [Thermotogae bacterium]|uniref:ABC transporter permease n=1 Tax=Kosmotoga sp. TaxID=1955248 RepID=UPI000F140723|nr:ABC transporter permease [Kosmotoga sp.]MBO8166516.1 ABC transporter permease [Kosmotoga sp.]MCD6159798.1 ABC transporter permease [Kosmotoga sp.]RKX49887.1 MAG: ABC transporter permease [Thermotogota bacterium]
MNKIKQTLVIFAAFFKESFRNKLEFFFSLGFPILFLVMFGFLFGGQESASALRVGFFSQDDSIASTMKNLKGFELKTYNSVDGTLKALENNEIELAVYFHDEKIKFTIKEGNPALEGEINTAISAIVSAIEGKLNGVKKIIDLKKIPVSSGSFITTESDYIMSGVIGISILSSGMFAVISIFGRYRKRGILNRLRATPMSPIAFIIGSTLTRFIVSVFSVFIIMLVNKLLFASKIVPEFVPLLIVVICSTMGMMALGLLLVLIFKEPQSAQSAGSVLFIVMTFASGVYFPIAFLPEFMKKLSMFLPVTYTVRLIRGAMGIIELSKNEFFFVNVVFAVLGILLLVTVSKLFLKAH